MNSRAGIRADFIRRLFAVAISVGFATTLIKMKWVESGSWPSLQEREQLMILVTGLVATVLSWDGYLASIAAKPLNGFWRFAIDIALVFIYMFFLISSQKPTFWLPILSVVFLLYVIWDWLSVREYMGSYDRSLMLPGTDETHRAKAYDVLQVYWRGFLTKPDTNRGPIITLSWAIYFGALMLLNQSPAQYQVFVTCAFAILGLSLYRRDKQIRAGAGNVAGYSMVFRAIIIGGLLALAALYFCVFRTPPASL